MDNLRIESKNENYTNEVPPCRSCCDREKAQLGACNGGLGVCTAYMEYQKGMKNNGKIIR